MPPLPQVGDCDVGAWLTNSILSTSIHSICSAETTPRESPTYPMKSDQQNEQQSETSAKHINAQTVTVAPTPKRPPLPKNRSTYQDRKKPGLSLVIPQSPDDVHAMPPICPVSLGRNVELKKRLSDSHFLFRPVSEDEQSKASSMNTKKTSSV